jgi:hypothetical protein
MVESERYNVFLGHRVSNCSDLFIGTPVNILTLLYRWIDRCVERLVYWLCSQVRLKNVYLRFAKGHLIGCLIHPLHSTPLFLSPYSPFSPTPNPELSTFPPDSRTTSLLVLVEHMSKILARVRQADVPTLTRRLKIQHLPGDVGHLSSTTLESLTEQVADMRTYFRRVLDDEKRHPHGSTTESLVTRKDFMLLIKLSRECLLS